MTSVVFTGEQVSFLFIQQEFRVYSRLMSAATVDYIILNGEKKKELIQCTLDACSYVTTRGTSGFHTSSVNAHAPF